MPSARAASVAAASERDPIARTSISGLATIAGSTLSMPILAVLSTPHTTRFMAAPVVPPHR